MSTTDDITVWELPAGTFGGETVTLTSIDEDTNASVPIDLTGGKVILNARESLKTDAAVVISEEVTDHADGENGVTVLPVDLRAVSAAVYEEGQRLAAELIFVDSLGVPLRFPVFVIQITPAFDVDLSD